MKTFKNVFNTWLNTQVNEQIKMIDEIIIELELDPKKWFDVFITRNAGDYSGYDILEVLLENFLLYVKEEFESILVDYIKPEGYNIYNMPYYGVYLEYDENTGEIYVREDDELTTLCKKLKSLHLDKKQELYKNKIFLYVINRTNLEFYSKNEIRVIKLKNLDEN